MKFEEVKQKLLDPSVTSNIKEYTKLSKEYKDLSDVKNIYDKFKNVVDNIANNEEILNTETDPEFKEMAKMELGDLAKEKEALEEEIKVLLIPKDPGNLYLKNL